MPFSRAHNAQAIQQNVGDAIAGIKGSFRIVPVCHNEEGLNAALAPPILVMEHPAWDKCYHKLNCALQQLAFNSRDVVGFWCDDDKYEPGFFAALEAKIESQILPHVTVVNMKRWFHGETVVDERPANPDNLRIGLVGLEQFYIRGDVVGNWRFNNYSHGDGDLMERMYKEMPHDFLFVPELFVNWNHLPP